MRFLASAFGHAGMGFWISAVPACTRLIVPSCHFSARPKGACWPIQRSKSSGVITVLLGMGTTLGVFAARCSIRLKPRDLQGIAVHWPRGYRPPETGQPRICVCCVGCGLVCVYRNARMVVASASMARRAACSTDSFRRKCSLPSPSGSAGSRNSWMSIVAVAMGIFSACLFVALPSVCLFRQGRGKKPAP